MSLKVPMPAVAFLEDVVLETTQRGYSGGRVDGDAVSRIRHCTTLSTLSPRPERQDAGDVAELEEREDPRFGVEVHAPRGSRPAKFPAAASENSTARRIFNSSIGLFECSPRRHAA